MTSRKSFLFIFFINKWCHRSLKNHINLFLFFLVMKTYLATSLNCGRNSRCIFLPTSNWVGRDQCNLTASFQTKKQTEKYWTQRYKPFSNCLILRSWYSCNKYTQLINFVTLNLWKQCSYHRDVNWIFSYGPIN